MSYAQPSLLWNEINLVPEKNVLVCQECRVGVPSKSLQRHLKDHHRQVPAQRRREIQDRFSHLPVLRTWSELLPQPDGSLPLGYLQDPVPGLFCPDYNKFKTTNYDCLRHHRSHQHSQISSVRNTHFDIDQVRCFLQSWTISRTHRKYWIVDSSPITSLTSSENAPSSTPLPPRGPKSTQDDPDGQYKAEADEERRLMDEHDGAPALTQQLEQDENTDWLRACEWPQWFAHRPIALIVAAARLPAASHHQSFVFGNWLGVDCVSSAEDELTLHRLVTATNLVFARCEETLQDTPRMLRCWLRSWSSVYLPYPFEAPQREATKRRYYRYFQQFFCYIYRIWRLGQRLKERTFDITGLQLDTSQTVMMHSVWTGLTSLPSNLDFPSAGLTTTSSSTREFSVIVENLFQLMMMFWTDLSANGSFRHNAIVHFSGVLGIHPYELAYRGAYDYTPYLSALIWVGRVLFLEYSLPLRAYNHLTYIWPDRYQYKDQVQRLN
jgi:hypothetical protein